MRVWKGSKRSKPRCNSSCFLERSAVVNEMLLRFRDAGHDKFCVSSVLDRGTAPERCDL